MTTPAPERVLLTGATGFIGQHLHRHLLGRGYAVRALLRSRAAAARLDPRCEIIEGQLTDADDLTRALPGVDRIVYGAGTVRGRQAEDFRAANETGVATLVRAIRGTPLERGQIVLLSSLAATRPELSHYAASKARGEMNLRSATDALWTILRPPAVYGPGDSEMRPLLDLARRGVAVRPGPHGQRLALLHVADLVRAVDACLTHGTECRQQAFAIDDGHPDGYDFEEIGDAVAGRPVREFGVPGWALGAVAATNVIAARLFGYAPMLTPGKVREVRQPRWVCDNSAFTRATGWRPEIDLAHGARALFR